MSANRIVLKRRFSSSGESLLAFNCKDRKLSSAQEITWISSTRTTNPKPSSISPSKYLQLLLSKHNAKQEIVPALSLQQYFVTLSESNFASYKEDVISAVRSRDVTSLKKIKNQGRSLECCNRFGESLIHMACRRGFIDVVSFLMEEGVSLRMIDDYGRTPLHDAFWTAKPNIELVKILISEEPALLFASDKRGHTPLDYVRRDDWDLWNSFLDRYFALILKHAQ